MKICRAVLLKYTFPLILLPFLSSCSKQEESEYRGTMNNVPQFAGVSEIEYGPFAIGNPGGQFAMSIFQDPKTFNDAKAGDSASSDITNLLYAYLIKRSQQDLQWKPMIGESWLFSEDQRTITHTLRKGLKWSDGSDLNARDFVFTYNHVILREDIRSNLRDSLFVNELPVTVTLIDDYSFSITADTVFAGLLNISMVHPYPRHILGPLIGWRESDGYEYDYKLVDGKVREINSSRLQYSLINSLWGTDTDTDLIVGNGPFKIDRYEKNKKIFLKRNPFYFEKDSMGNQLPYLEKITMSVVADKNDQLEKFKSGETDFYSLSGKDYSVLIDQKSSLGIEIYNVGPESATQFFTMNQNPNALNVRPEVLLWNSNKRFREALAHLVDRQTIINNIAYGFGYPQYSFVPGFSPYYWEMIEELSYKFDPDKAIEILDRLGWIDNNNDGIREDDKGNNISLRLITNSNNTIRESICELMVTNAQKAGIDINFQSVNFYMLEEKLLSGEDWDMALIGLTGAIDPISGANVFKSQGNLHTIEPNQRKPRRDWEREVDEAWSFANNTIDENQRKEGWEIIQKIYAEEVPWIYTYNQALLHAYNAGLGNIQPRPVDDLDEFGIIQYLYWK